MKNKKILQNMLQEQSQQLFRRQEQDAELPSFALFPAEYPRLQDGVLAWKVIEQVK